MPIFEYRCKKCGKLSEFLEGVTQEKIRKACSHCGSHALSKVFSKTNIASHDTSSSNAKCRDLCGRKGPGSMPPCARGMCQ